jgi:hypothetical protein
MALNNFIPQVWAGSILRNLNKSLVYGAPTMVNRDYEGDIANFGDTVKIQSIGRVTVVDYTKYTSLGAPQQLTDATRSLVIDQAKAFNFEIDDIDTRQQNPKVMAEATFEAGYALAETADRFIASKFVDAAAGNLVGSTGTPVALLSNSPTDAYDKVLVPLKQKLDEANVPTVGRSVVIPPAFEALLLRDNRFVSFGTVENRNDLANGMVGRAAGFDIMVSNNVPLSTGRYSIQASHPMYGTWAEQIAKVEAYRPENKFSDALKGLHLYGFKVVRPDCLAIATVTIA